MTQDTLELIGSIGNFPAKLTLPLSPEAFNVDGDFIAGLLASLEVLNFQPPLPGQVATSAPQAQVAGPARYASAPGGSTGGGCPTHGTTKQKTGFRGAGFECGAWSENKEPWSKDGKLMQDGRTVYYCASKWG